MWYMNMLISLLIITSHLVGQSHELIEQPINHIVAGKSFSLRSSVYVQASGNDYNINEFYSDRQKRAKLLLEGKGLRIGESSQFHYDLKSKTLVRYSAKDNNGCINADFDNGLNTELYGISKAKILEIYSKINSFPELEYTIGPAKLLHFIAQQSSKLVRSDWTPTNIRNHPTKLYQLNIESNGKGMELYVYYEDSRDKKPPVDKIPLSVLVRLGDIDYLNIDYYEFKYLSDDEMTQKEETPIITQSDGLTIDLFAFPLGIGCVQNLEDYPKTDSLLNGITKFSFSADSHLIKHTKRYKSFVAYDKLASMLRVDSTRDDDSSPETVSYKNTKIISLHNNRQYLVDFGYGSDQIEDGSKCSITHVIPPYENFQRIKFDSDKFLFGTNTFKFIGKAKFRGLNARVFDGSADYLPDWIEQPLVYKDAKDTFCILRHHDLFPGTKLSTVVFLEDREDSDCQPVVLGMKSYYLNYYVPLEGRQLLDVKFSSFMPELSDSPVGHSARDLFSYENLCASTSDITSEVNLVLARNTLVNKKVDIDWLKNSPAKRNNALRYTVIDMLGFPAMAISDVESRVVGSDDTISIAAKFKLHKQIEDILNVRLSRVGTMNLKNYSGRSVKSNSIFDCLSSLGADNQIKYLLYNPATFTCIVDIKASGDELLKNFDGTNGYDMLFMVNTNPDSVNMIDNNWLDAKDFTYIEGRGIPMTNPDETSELNMRTVPMYIKKLKIHQINTNSAKNWNSLVGFTLVSNTQDTRTIVASIDQEPENERPMNWDRCETKCLSDSKCKSFSFCLGIEPKCILSTIAVVSETSLNFIKSSKVHTLSSGSMIEVPIETDVNITLERDFQCEIHNKNYLKMFKKSSSNYRGQIQGQLIAVDKPEECAEKCFLSSLTVLSNQDALNKELHSLILDSSPDGYKLDKLRKEFKAKMKEEMKSFCSHFDYSDLVPDDKQSNLLNDIFGEQRVKKQGICHIPSISKPEKPLARGKNDIYLDFDLYDFDFSSLYDKSIGFRLLASPATESELDAFEKITRGGNVTSKEYQTLINAKKEQKNFRLTDTLNVQECAAACFMQTKLTWPACRSFDMIIDKFDFETRSMVCQFNTENLSVAEKSTPYKFGSIKMFHYEPRFEFVQDAIDATYLNDKIQNSNSHLRVGTFWLMLLWFLGAASGLKLATLLLELFYKFIDRVSVSNGGENRFNRLIDDKIPSLGDEKNQIL